MKQLEWLSKTGPWFVTPLAGDVLSGKEQASIGDCVLIDDIRQLKLSSDAQCVVLSWGMF
ncbi:MAG: hypothetical protein B7Y00_03915 [Sphingomonadales bacterium 17-56-6]|nr:MAG: hypothetical protein B7Y44_01835 [Sphingomonadales bacterium 28-55-16]OYZ88584.1 MAG: hypothetical protein B7Y00_03915 [Sphingomonadales bacterium 17-56-6]